MQFKPLQDFEDDNVNASNGQAVAQIAQTQKSELSEDELAYKEEVEFCLEDAPEIDAHSRKFLERKRQKLGLSETRAQEIEDMVKASLESFTDEEKSTWKLLMMSLKMEQSLIMSVDYWSVKEIIGNR